MDNAEVKVTMSKPFGTLYDFDTGKPVRAATARELLRSYRSTMTGGFLLGTRWLYVDDEPEGAIQLAQKMEER